MGKAARRRQVRSHVSRSTTTGAGPRVRNVMQEIADKPVVTARFDLTDGEDGGPTNRRIVRVVTWSEVQDFDSEANQVLRRMKQGVPVWVRDPRRSWPEPQSGILIEGIVLEAMLHHALEWLGLPEDYTPLDTSDDWTPADDDRLATALAGDPIDPSPPTRGDDAILAKAIRLGKYHA